MNGGTRGPRLALAAFAALRFAALLSPTMFLWGLNAGRFLPPAASLGLALLPALALVPAVGRGLDATLEGLALETRAGAAALALMPALLVFLLNDRIWFVGDFLLREGAMREPGNFRLMFPQAQPLDVLLHHTLPQALLARGVDTTLAARLVGASEAALLGVLARRFALGFGLRGAAALATAGAVLAGGCLALFAGYSKPTVEVGLLAIAIGVFGARAIRGGRGLLAVALAFTAALGFHRSALSLLPGVLAIAVLAWQRPGGARRGEAIAALVVVLGALGWFLPRLWHLFTAFDLSTNFTSFEVRRQGGPIAAAFSGLRLLDLANLALLHAPLVVLLPALARMPRREGEPAGDEGAVLTGLGALFLGHLPAVLFVYVTQGPFRDWDANAGAFAALALFTAAVLARGLRAGALRDLAGAAALAAFAATLTLILAQHDLGGGLRRAHAFLTEPPARTDSQRLATLDFLGLRYLRLERFAESTEAFAALAESAPHPRALILGGTAALLAGRIAPAEDAFRLCTERDSTQSVAWFGLWLAATRSGDSTLARAAERRVLAYSDSGPEMQRILEHVDHYPKLWELMPRGGGVRRR